MYNFFPDLSEAKKCRALLLRPFVVSSTVRVLTDIRTDMQNWRYITYSPFGHRSFSYIFVKITIIRQKMGEIPICVFWF